MKRRTFLSGLLATVAAAKADLPASAALRILRYDFQRVPLAGFQYHAGESVWEQLAEGATLELVREPGNPYDANAIRVDWTGHKLGYVPRVDNTALATLMDQGVRARALISHLAESHSPWERMQMDLSIEISA